MKNRLSKDSRKWILALSFLLGPRFFLFADATPSSEYQKLADQAFQAKDYALCLKWNLKAAAENNPVAQRRVGYLYANGLGVRQDYNEALGWYQMAAAQGDAKAECNLGAMYEKGYGVTQNYHEAMAWYQKSASQGNDSAQLNIGCFYEHGYGVAQDYREALKWYGKSAGQGNDLAKKLTIELKAKIAYEQGSDKK